MIDTPFIRQPMTGHRQMISPNVAFRRPGVNDRQADTMRAALEAARLAGDDARFQRILAFYD